MDLMVISDSHEMPLASAFHYSLMWCLGDEQENLEYHMAYNCSVTSQESLAKVFEL
jgi:hypothetical protein